MIEDYKYLFLDMDAFFASVEQQENKQWRARAVAIVHHNGPSGSIIAQSYQAKRKGIYTGQRVGDAKKLLPGLVVASSRLNLYSHYHKKIRRILDDFSPWVTPYSIDEFSVLLAPKERSTNRAKDIALNIKKSIKEKVGEYVTGSIGIAPNVFLSKTASKIKKPDGLFVIRKEEIKKTFTEIKDITFLCGINKATAFQLATAGIKTPLDLWSAGAERLRAVMGQAGERWYLNLHGYDIKKTEGGAKSVGHSRVLAPKQRNRKGAREALVELSINVARRLRACNLEAQKIEVSIKNRGANTRGILSHAHERITPSNRQATITAIAVKLLEKCAHNSPYHVAISSSSLTYCKNSTQLSLIENKNQHAIDKIIDSINKKFGDGALNVYNFPRKSKEKND